MDWHLSTLLKLAVPNRAQETTQLLYLRAIRILLFQVNLLAQRKKNGLTVENPLSYVSGNIRKRNRLSLAKAGFEKAELAHVSISQGLPNTVTFPKTFPSAAPTQAPLVFPDDCRRINLFLEPKMSQLRSQAGAGKLCTLHCSQELNSPKTQLRATCFSVPRIMLTTTHLNYYINWKEGAHTI